MKKISLMISAALVAAAVTLMPGSPALAADRVTLRDGRVLEGKIVREEQGYVWFETTAGGIAKTDVFGPHEITAVERESGAPKAAETPKEVVKEGDGKAEKPKDAAAKPDLSGAPRAAVLTLGGGVKNDMVGIYMTAESMRRAIPLLKEENVGIVVLRVNSGGGYTFEVPRLSDVIEFEYKKNFQTVGWIESAISAAAMTASTIEDIYFMPEGHMGAATEFSGAGVATKGRQLEETLFKMENIVTRGKHPMEIMRAMQILVPLSANINPVTGEVAFFQNLEGELILNPENRILTLNAETAAKIRFSRGTAANVDELGKLMGYSELTWVGERVAGVPYPVSKAEKYMRGFREQTGEDERRLREYQTLYGESIQRAQGATAETRGLFIGKARDALSKVRRMVDNNPNFAFFIFGMTPPQWKEWLQEQDEMLRRLGTPPRR